MKDTSLWVSFSPFWLEVQIINVKSLYFFWEVGKNNEHVLIKYIADEFGFRPEVVSTGIGSPLVGISNPVKPVAAPSLPAVDVNPPKPLPPVSVNPGSAPLNNLLG